MAHSEGSPKTIAIILHNKTDQPNIVTINEGTTVREALELARVGSDVSLTSPSGDGELQPDDDLYALVKEGDKLYGTPAFVSGGS